MKMRDILRWIRSFPTPWKGAEVARRVALEVEGYRKYMQSRLDERDELINRMEENQRAMESRLKENLQMGGSAVLCADGAFRWFENKGAIGPAARAAPRMRAKKAARASVKARRRKSVE